MSAPVSEPGFAARSVSTAGVPAQCPTAEREQKHPMGAYLVLTASYFSLTAGSLFLLRRKLPRSPRRGPGFLVQSLATFALARIVTRDKVAMPLRAPFTRFQRSAGAGEVDEEPRGSGIQRVVGELLTCPYCATPWVATAVAVGSVAAPRAAGTLTRTFATVAVSWFLHQGYALLRKEA